MWRRLRSPNGWFDEASKIFTNTNNKALRVNPSAKLKTCETGNIVKDATVIY